MVRFTSSRTSESRFTGGFTLVELMVVVAIIGTLAAVASVSYSRYIKRARSAEVPRMFGEFMAKEKAFQAEFGRFLSTGNEGTYWPTAMTLNKQADARTGSPGDVAAAPKIDTGGDGLWCQYNAVAGAANSTAGRRPWGKTCGGSRRPTAPGSMSWRNAIGTPGSTNSIYAQKDDRTDIIRDNEGT